MKKIFLIVCVSLGLTMAVNAQVKVGNNPTALNSSAALEIESANKGFLPPRVALQSISDAVTIPSPAKGLIVFNLSGPIGLDGLYINSGTPALPKWSIFSTTVDLGLSSNIVVGTTVSIGGILDGSQSNNKLSLTRADGATLTWFINSTSSSGAVRHPLVMSQNTGVSKYAVTSFAVYGASGAGNVNSVGAATLTTSTVPLTLSPASAAGLLPNAHDNYIYFIQNTQAPWDSYRIEVTVSPDNGSGCNYTISILRKR